MVVIDALLMLIFPYISSLYCRNVVACNFPYSFVLTVALCYTISKPDNPKKESWPQSNFHLTFFHPHVRLRELVFISCTNILMLFILFL
ncbi:hypothetical protein AHF37_04465 [Paragonimus kellicotti]|nr:hypothetical protein AHF37_04465 [Paragonimus kellicotti]